MAIWKNKVVRVASISTPELEELLHEEGEKGWELVQILKNHSASGIEYRALFKTEKPLD